ncbi:FAD/NAD(P)-binding protein [Pseudomonas sp. EpS/L25]|uniref:FAD/NAD(P)-binding protein n=1 Tax=Pseudomonas sp. EpS/L25 TaxID=1749078 RepID=UPI0009E79045|nr:FAD/NAD(P)-binding protein [Pseudomonas sp. EpS/L25]
MSGKVITIVGSGASSVSFIDALLENLCVENNILSDLTIFLLDKRPQFGRGLAYADDTSTSLLNTRASFISPFSDKPGHFYNWLLQNKSIWEDDFPDLILSPDAFLPRSLFGNYLTHMLQSLSKKAVEIGCRVITVNDEAYRITFAHDGKIVISTRGNLSFPSDHVVLSCGNGGSLEYKNLEDTPGFFSSPYPIKHTTRVIPKEARVAIIGSRLSAIDMAIGLKASGHTGPIVFHSRTGSLPAVRGIQGRYKPEYLTPQRIK